LRIECYDPAISRAINYCIVASYLAVVVCIGIVLWLYTDLSNED